MTPKTEYEKMLAGESYNIHDAELDAMRQKTQDLYWRFNQTQNFAERQTLLEQLIGHVGHNSIIMPPFYCSYGQNIYLGDFTYLNFLCTILDNNTVQIGSHVMLGPNVQIYTAAHPLQAQRRNQGWEIARPIVIGDNVWIGGGALLLPGVKIGINAVVGAGAVVSRDVPAHTVVAGNPARVIKQLTEP